MKSGPPTTYLCVAREELFVSSAAQGPSIAVHIQTLAGLVADTSAARSTAGRGSTPLAPLRTVALAARDHKRSWQVDIRSKLPLWS